jgi:AAA15 family ATPase/GTPase
MLENIYFLEQKICTAIICVSYESCEKCHRNSWDEESSCKYHYYKWNHLFLEAYSKLKCHWNSWDEVTSYENNSLSYSWMRRAYVNYTTTDIVGISEYHLKYWYEDSWHKIAGTSRTYVGNIFFIWNLFQL